MFRNSYQKGFLSVFSSTGSKPLQIWKSCVKNGHVKRLTDCDLTSLVVELIGRNVATTYISAPPPGYCSLAVKLPFLTLIMKNLKKFFTFEVQILDDRNQMRRFRFSNYQTATRVRPFCTSMPLCLSPGWNQMHLNLADFVRRAYNSNYIETVRIQVHANVRIRRMYFSDRLYADDEKPQEYRLFSIDTTKKPDKKWIPKPQKMVENAEETVRPGTPVEQGVGEEVAQVVVDEPMEGRKQSKVSFIEGVTFHEMNDDSGTEYTDSRPETATSEFAQIEEPEDPTLQMFAKSLEEIAMLETIESLIPGEPLIEEFQTEEGPKEELISSEPVNEEAMVEEPPKEELSEKELFPVEPVIEEIQIEQAPEEELNENQ